MGIFPKVIARKAYNGRAALQAAFQRYFSAGYEQEPDVPAYTKGRANNARKYGFSGSDVGRFEIASLHVATSNAIPTVFWMLLYVMSDPVLTEDIRQECLKTITTTTTASGKIEITIDATEFTTLCPLLMSAYQETQRISSAQLTTRIVLADTLISDASDSTSYLLKKGSVVQLPAGVPHRSESIWGHDKDSFNARRFLFKAEKQTEEQKMQKRAFIPFGGGRHLCPGRHFAMMEILGTVALMVLGFEVRGEDGEMLRIPEGEIRWQKFAEGVSKPIGQTQKMGVRIKRRPGLEHVKWSFVAGTGPEK